MMKIDRVIRVDIIGVVVCGLSCHFIFMPLLDGNIVREDE